LGERLTLLGLDVIEHATVGDSRTDIAQALQRLSGVVDVVIATGGLGPTTDDLTAEVVASVLGVALTTHEPSLTAIRDRYWKVLGREMPASNAKQAELPTGCDILANGVGTAPGFAVRLGRAQLFFLPGVPAEMKPMFEQSVVPHVAVDASKRSHQIRLRSFGLSESQTQDLLVGVEANEPGVVIGYRAHFPEIEIKVLATPITTPLATSLEHAAGDESVVVRAERVAARVKERLGSAIYGGEGDSYPAWVGGLLRARGWTLSVAESCTGGLVGKLLTDAAGSSDFLLLDTVTYANSAKQNVLGVPEETLRVHGAVSEQVARAMAEGVLRVGGSNLSIAITGIAGPGGGSEEKPVGTVWIASASCDGETVAERLFWPLDRDRVRMISAYAALRMVAQRVRPS
jgi:nicotinamide-nucleotide amidase